MLCVADVWLSLVNSMDEISSISSSEENLEVSDEYLSSDYFVCKVVEGLCTNEPECTKVEMTTMKLSDVENSSCCSSDDSYHEELNSSL